MCKPFTLCMSPLPITETQSLIHGFLLHSSQCNSHIEDTSLIVLTISGIQLCCVSTKHGLMGREYCNSNCFFHYFHSVRTTILHWNRTLSLDAILEIKRNFLLIPNWKKFISCPPTPTRSIPKHLLDPWQQYLQMRWYTH